MRRATILCARAAPLSFPAITQALQHTPGWRLDGNNNGVISREFEFRDFLQAMAFINTVATECEIMGHHPTWTNTYNKLHVRLTTHDVGNRVTQRDIDLARYMNHVFGTVCGN